MSRRPTRTTSASLSQRQLVVVVGMAVLICSVFAVISYLLLNDQGNRQSEQTSLVNSATTITPRPAATRPAFPPTWTPTSVAGSTAKPRSTDIPDSTPAPAMVDTPYRACLIGTWRVDDLAQHLLILKPASTNFGFKVAESQGDVLVTFSSDGQVNLQATRFSAKIATQSQDEVYSMDGRVTAGYTVDEAGLVTLTNLDPVHLRFASVMHYGDQLGGADDLTTRLAAVVTGVKPPMVIRPFTATVALDCSEHTLKYAPGFRSLHMERVGSAVSTSAADCLVGTWRYKDPASIIVPNLEYYNGVTRVAENQGQLTYTFSPNGQVGIKAEGVAVTLKLFDEPFRGNQDLIYSFNGQVTASYSITGTHTVVLANVNSRDFSSTAIARIPTFSGSPDQVPISAGREMPPFFGLMPFPGQSDITAMYRCNGDTLDYFPAWPITLDRSDPY